MQNLPSAELAWNLQGVGSRIGSAPGLCWQMCPTASPTGPSLVSSTPVACSTSCVSSVSLRGSRDWHTGTGPLTRSGCSSPKDSGPCWLLTRLPWMTPLSRPDCAAASSAALAGRLAPSPSLSRLW